VRPLHPSDQRYTVPQLPDQPILFGHRWGYSSHGKLLASLAPANRAAVVGYVIAYAFILSGMERGGTENSGRMFFFNSGALIERESPKPSLLLETGSISSRLSLRA
jgi:hypothetical protein